MTHDDDKHHLFHEEAAIFEKSISSGLRAILTGDTALDIENVASLLGYIRMKAKEIVNDSDEVLAGLEKMDMPRVLDSLLSVKDDIDFLVSEADKLKEPLVVLINCIEEKVTGNVGSK